MTAFNNNNEIIPPSVNTRYIIDLRIWGKKKTTYLYSLCIYYKYRTKTETRTKQSQCKLKFHLYLFVYSHMGNGQLYVGINIINSTCIPLSIKQMVGTIYYYVLYRIKIKTTVRNR